MYWVNFLHIYQPVDQSKEILKRVVNESYRPLFKGLLKIPNIKINLNINSALAELLIKERYSDVVAAIRKLAEKQKLEFTESAKYHPLLPFLQKEEIIRQIQKNHKDNERYFGKAYKPVCVFPPEMAYSSEVGRVVSELGYRMIILDEISYSGGRDRPPTDRLFTIKGTDNLIAVFRERRISNCIMSGIIRNKEEFLDLIQEELKEEKYVCTAMDGETFGHHRPGLEKAFLEILDSKKPKQIFLSEIPDYFDVKRKVVPVKATWASAQEDIEKGVQFYSWNDPKNKVHRLQWAFLNYVLSKAKTKKLTPQIQDKLDKIMASDQFFWASGEPWWSIEMIEKGAWTMLQTFKSLPSLSKNQLEKGEDYYKEILSIIFWWQRSGKIETLAKKYKEEVKIPFKERTLEKNKPEVYYAFLEMMRQKMEGATKKKNFERAILWRDAIWKLETKNDIYDALHVVDLLRLEVFDSKLKKLMEKYKEKYKKIKPGQPEPRKVL